MHTQLTPSHREELIAKLVAEYKQELAELTDQELLSHVQMSNIGRQMSAEQWQMIFQQVTSQKR